MDNRKTESINLNQLEHILRDSRPIYIHQIRICQKNTLIQSKNIQIKNKSALDVISPLLTKKYDSRSQSHMQQESSEEDWNIITLSENTITDVPPFILQLFTEIGLDANAFYSTSFDDINGFWYCILSALDNTFIGRTKQSQLKYILEFKQTLAGELENYFESLHYRGYGYVRTNMISILQQNEAYYSCVGHYVCDFLKINVATINENKELFWIAPYKEDRVTLILWRELTKWGVIIHPDNKSHFLKNVKDALETVCKKGNTISWTKNSNTENDPVILKKIKKEIKALGIKDLIERAEKLEINTFDYETGKKKIKDKLLKEVFKALTGQEMIVVVNSV